MKFLTDLQVEKKYLGVSVCSESNGNFLNDYYGNLKGEFVPVKYVKLKVIQSSSVLVEHECASEKKNKFSSNLFFLTFWLSIVVF